MAAKRFKSSSVRGNPGPAVAGEDRFSRERELLLNGVRLVAGVDEAGRGPLAGPVLAAAVMFPPEWIEAGMPDGWETLNDSKQLSPRQREVFFEWITACPDIQFSIAEIPSEVIDEINILQATHQAMNQALVGLRPQPQHALVDGLPVASLELHHTAIVKGDTLSFSIAAAAILAKVTRDRLMMNYDEAYPQYGFADHKGYATPRHCQALRKFGPCPIHRRSFAPVRQDQPELFDPERE